MQIIPIVGLAKNGVKFQLVSYGFAKNQRDNIGNQELKALKRLAAEILAYSDQALNKALKAGELREGENDG